MILPCHGLGLPTTSNGFAMKYVAIPQHTVVHMHFILSLKTHKLVKLELYFPWYGLWMVFKGL